MSLNTIADYVQQEADLVKIVSAYLPLTPSSKAMKANCPFHPDKSGSFMVSPSKNIFRCFGCGKDGGPVEFIMAIESQSREQAVKLLAEKLNLPK